MIPREEFEALFRETGLLGDYEKFSRYCGLLQYRFELTRMKVSRDECEMLHGFEQIGRAHV